MPQIAGTATETNPSPIRKAFDKTARTLRDAYLRAEEKYYQAADWLQERGVPVYLNYIDPIEKRGIPLLSGYTHIYEVGTLQVGCVCAPGFIMPLPIYANHAPIPALLLYPNDFRSPYSAVLGFILDHAQGTRRLTALITPTS